MNKWKSAKDSGFFDQKAKEKDAEYLARLRKLKSMAEVDATLFLEFLESD